MTEPSASNPLRIALLAVDGRESEKRYSDAFPRFGTAVSALLEGLTERTDLEIHVVSAVRRHVQSNLRLGERTWSHAVEVPHWAMMRSGYAGAVWLLRRFLRKLNPQVVHGQGTERECALAAAFCGRKNLITIHGHMRAIAELKAAPRFSFYGLAAMLERFAVRRAGGVICISNYTEKRVSNTARKTWLLPNAVEASLFNVIRPTDTPPVFVSIGTIASHKNQVELIRALDGLGSKCSFTLRFLGSGDNDDPYFQEFRSLVQTRQWCHWEGFVDRVAIRAELQRARALVHPSREDNCPMVLIEAMAAGVPIIASNVGGIPDLLEPAVTGVLCDVSEMEQFTVAAKSILEDPLTAALMAHRAREVARRRFHPEVIAAHHAKIYYEINSGS